MIKKIIPRLIQKQLEKSLFKGKIVIVYGARQVGKTTLVREIGKKYSKTVYLNCDEPDVREALTGKTSTELKSYLGNQKLVIIDEAQRVPNIGITLKLLVDNFPEIQIVATGSSSLDLSNKTKEPLTGRKFEFYLFPFSVTELKFVFNQTEIDRLIPEMTIFGTYPEIILGNFSQKEREINLKNLAFSYLFKDLLAYQNIKNPEVLEKLLQALALQIGSEVSFNELALLLGIDKKTVESYVRILEQSFVIFRLAPFSRNIRNELKKMRKIYFFDNGIRNALINNLNPLNLRQDTGGLWENFMLSERIKHNSAKGRDVNSYFWRTTAGGEIDYLEERKGEIRAFEIKYQKEKIRIPKAFLNGYPSAKIKVINRENYLDFVG